MYWTGWCSALGVVGPNWSQLHEPTMIWAWVWLTRFGDDRRPVEGRRQPEPEDGVRVDRGRAGGLERGRDAEGGVVHDRVAQEHDAQRIGGRRGRRQPDRLLALVAARLPAPPDQSRWTQTPGGWCPRPGGIGDGG